MALNNLITDKLQVSQDQLEEFYTQGFITADLYYQCLITLAASHVNTHDTEKALILINRCAPEYFDGPIIEQMKADPTFGQIAAKLVYGLVRVGVLPDFNEDANMAPDNYSN